MYEELVGRDEDVGPSAIEKILRVTSRSTPPGNLAEAIACIEDDAVHGRRPAMFAALRELAGLSAADEETPVAPPAIERAPAPAAALNSAEQPCPTCGSFTLYRSKAKNLPERVRRQFSARRLFRCTTCRWRGWLLPMHINDADAVESAAMPDLAALDVALQASAPTHRRSFSPRDLQ